MTLNIIINFIITFLLLHTLQWCIISFYYYSCIDISFFGYFKNMINGHGPICYSLMNISYYAQNQMYNLIANTTISSGITLFLKNIKQKNL